MKKLICIFFLALFTIVPVFFCFSQVYAEVLTGSVSAVPDSFFGTWRVVSKLVDTDSPATFKENNLDLWNLSKLGDVITLCNPFNGAKADITVNKSDCKSITFVKTGKYGGKNLTDTVEIRLGNDTFEGVDTIQLETYSNVDGKIIKTETAKYSVKGEKIAGQSIK